MRHITFTGYYAGLPVCSVNRIEATARGDLFHHAGRWLDNPELVAETCPECRKLWDAADDDSEAAEQIFQDNVERRLFS